MILPPQLIQPLRPPVAVDMRDHQRRTSRFAESRADAQRRGQGGGARAVGDAVPCEASGRGLRAVQEADEGEDEEEDEEVGEGFLGAAAHDGFVSRRDGGWGEYNGVVRSLSRCHS